MLSPDLSNPVASLPPRSLLHRAADRVGATASALCAVHCLALPFVIALLPALGLGFLADHAFERGFVVFASVLALASLAVGFRHHRRLLAFAFLVPGIALLLTGVLIAGDHGSYAHAVLVALGGVAIAIAHLTNLRLTHGHVHTAACAH